jgi:ribosomal protein S18 acetylase RimI-like enzyme
VKVRQARPEDVPALVHLFEELDRMQRDWRVFTPRPGFYDEVAHKYRRAISSEDSLVAVAEHEGEVVGMAFAQIQTPSRFSDERALELSGVMVRSGHRGLGVGRALVQEATRFAADHDVNWIELKTFVPNESAMGFWRALGFNPRVVQLLAPVGEAARLSAVG